MCERCGGEVVRKVKSQWMLKITAYAERLLEDLEKVNYMEKIKAQQRNWIGRSEGAEVDFAFSGTGKKIRVFTTRPDTLFGATYMVLSPEHPLIDEERDKIANWDEVAAYREAAARKSDFERSEVARDKTGVPLKGLMAVNPATARKSLSDIRLRPHVLRNGVIMAMPGHDRETGSLLEVRPSHSRSGGWRRHRKEALVDTEEGTIVNSGFPQRECRCRCHQAMTIGWKERVSVPARSTTSSATGSFPGRGIGESPFPWCTAKSTAGFRCPKTSFRSFCLT